MNGLCSFFWHMQIKLVRYLSGLLIFLKTLAPTMRNEAIKSLIFSMMTLRLVALHWRGRKKILHMTTTTTTATSIFSKFNSIYQAYVHIIYTCFIITPITIIISSCIIYLKFIFQFTSTNEWKKWKILICFFFLCVYLCTNFYFISHAPPPPHPNPQQFDAICKAEVAFFITRAFINVSDKFTKFLCVTFVLRLIFSIIHHHEIIYTFIKHGIESFWYNVWVKIFKLNCTWHIKLNEQQ